MLNTHGRFRWRPKMERVISSETGKTETGGGVVSSAPLKFIIHLHSPKHTLRATV